MYVQLNCVIVDPDAANRQELATFLAAFGVNLVAQLPGTDTLPSAQALYLPLMGPQSPVGVLAWRPDEPKRLHDLSQRQLLDAFSTQLALALERDRPTSPRES